MNLWSLNYRPHARFVEPARTRPQIWRFLLGLTLASGIFLVLSQMLLGTVFSMMPPETARQIMIDRNTGQTAVSMFILLSQLGLIAVSAAMVCVMVHKRAPHTLIGPLGLAMRQFLVAGVAMILLLAVLFVLPPYNYGSPLERNMSVGRWVMLVPFALIAVFVQTSAEEIFFRGYVQQQLAARFKSPLVWVVLPSALFGLAHYQPDSAGSNASTIALWATLFGVLMADITARAGTLGPALAIHFFNNVSSFVFISMPDHMSGLALYVLPFGMLDEDQMSTVLLGDFGFIIVCWLAARVAIRA